MKERNKVTIKRAEDKISSLGATILGDNIPVTPTIQAMPQVVNVIPKVGEESSDAPAQETEEIKRPKEEKSTSTEAPEKKKPKEKKKGGLVSDYIDQMAKVSNRKGKKSILVYLDPDVSGALDTLIREKTDKGISISRSRLINMVLRNALYGDDEQ